MSEYISKKNVREIILNQPSRYDILENIESAPSADVRENIHGEWVSSDIPESILSKCSVCGFQLGAFTFNFCPNCGADMREPIGEKGTE